MKRISHSDECGFAKISERSYEVCASVKLCSRGETKIEYMNLK